jgi:hypothetical protein
LRFLSCSFAIIIKEEGRGKKEEGRKKREEGRGKREEGKKLVIGNCR